MPITKLIINGEREFNLGENIVSIGRVTDNSISFPDDSNVSRFHVEIEPRDGDYWLIELGSSNGTTINGAPVTREALLKDGDEILLGGTSHLVFEIEKEKAEASNAAGSSAQSSTGSEEAESDAAADKAETEIIEDSEKTSKTPKVLITMGVICGLAVVLTVVAVIYSFSSSTKCEATATITSPGSGQTISKSTEITADVKSNSECVDRVVFVLEDKEIASASSEPYKASLEPSAFASFASDGRVHNLRVVLEDAEGNQIPQSSSVGLIFESLATPTPTPEEVPEATPTPKKAQTNKILTIADTQEMLKRLNSEFRPALNYNCNVTCLQEVKNKTLEFAAAEGYSERAKGPTNELSDTINVSFVREMNLPAPLGYFLAMSRSKFNLQKQGDGEGLWRMSNQFAIDNSLNGMCGTETLSDPSQACASRVAALYMSKYLMPLFDQDVIYAVAAFGMSPIDAAKWKEQLPPNRADFWNVIKTPQQRDEVIKFLAAGIVTQNPQKFGLKKDQPMSEFYKIAMGN